VLDRKRPSHSISLNHLYISTGRGNQRRLNTFAEATKNGWITIVVDAALPLPPGFLVLDLALYPPDGRRRDADGGIKLAQDAVFEAYRILYLVRGVDPTTARRLADDYRVVDLHVHRHDPDRACPRIEVAVSAWTEAR
jgi:hypothetical protein